MELGRDIAAIIRAVEYSTQQHVDLKSVLWFLGRFPESATSSIKPLSSEDLERISKTTKLITEKVLGGQNR